MPEKEYACYWMKIMERIIRRGTLEM